MKVQPNQYGGSGAETLTISVDTDDSVPGSAQSVPAPTITVEEV